MPSDPRDRRLHPASALFGVGRQFRNLVVPGLFVLFSAGVAGWSWQLWVMPLLIPYAIASIGRYLSFRYRYEPNELVIRTGFIFRNERHVPYARIQNIDAVQNVLHRMLRVAEVRVETGGGEEPEARLAVLPLEAYEEMRRRVFLEKGQRAAVPAEPVASTSRSRLLHLPVRELLLCGFIQNRGGVVIGAVFGILWELGFWDGFTDRIFGEQAWGRGVVRDLLRAVFAGGAHLRRPGRFPAADPRRVHGLDVHAAL
jgi:putative membrane protein